MNNFMLNFLLNLFVVILSNKKINYIRVNIVSAIEAIFTIVYLYFDLNYFYIKLILLLVISSILTKINSIKDYFGNVIRLLLITVIIGGIGYLITNIIDINTYEIKYSIRLTIVYTILVILLCCNRYLILYFNKFRRKLKFEEKVKIYIKGNIIDTTAFYDTGNTLYQDFKPVCILKKEILNQVYSEFEINKLVNEIEVKTIMGNQYFKTIVLDELCITSDKKIYKKVVAVISNNPMEYGLLLHSDLR